MVRISLGLVVFSGVVLLSSCSDSKRSSRDHDAGEGGEGGDASGGTTGKGAAAGRAGSAGKGGSGGASGSASGGTAGKGTAGKGGAAGSSAGGTDSAGASAEGGADTGGDGNAGAGESGSGGAGGGAGEGSAGEGNAGAGGEPSTLTGCERTPRGDVLVSADFSSDVFLDSAWTKSDTSVSLAGGLVTIGADAGYDDYVEVALASATLPIVIEVRARTAETATTADILPVVVAFYEGRWVDVAYSTSWGWMLSNASAYAESQIRAPTQGEWVSLRALIGATSSELCVKRESDESYGRVATTSMTLPSGITAVRIRQAWDYLYEIDELRVVEP
jgi:hypothetical protein